jgi:anti-sigma-K factor RskA
LRHESITEQGQEVAALYALGALSQNEARAFESHLREGCAACQQELEEFDRVVGTLGTSAGQVAPPAYLRDLLKARLDKEEQAPVQAGVPQASIIQFPHQHKSVEPPVEKPRSSPARTWLPWAVAASLLIACLGSVLLWQSDRRALQASIDESKAERLAALRERDELRSSLSKQEVRSQELAQINAILASPDQPVVLSLKMTEDAPATMAASSATVYWNKQGHKWLVSADLPRPPEGKAYQLWFITPGGPVSAGLMKPDETGHGFMVVNVPSDAETIVAAAITLEPEGGSPQPTSPVLAMGKA